MGQLAAYFVIGIVALGEFIMHYVGNVDDFLGRLLVLAGIINPRYQLYAYLVIMVALVVLAMRVLGGLLGWVILILLVLMLMHRVVPGAAAPPGAFQTPLQNVL